MQFKNVKVPEGINVSRHSPLAEFFLLTVGAFVVFAALGLGAIFLGAALARHTPVSWENALAAAVFEQQASVSDGEAAPIVTELQALADRLTAHMALPEGLTIKAHYCDTPEINAFATVGGHVMVCRGLLSRMPSENALAMVMAHEIAHVAHRDIVASLGGAVLLQVLLAVVLDSSPDTLEQLITGPNALLLTGFTREAERDADAAGLAAVAALYGHVADSASVFELFLEQPEPPELLSTHPLSRDRIDEIAATARVKAWALEGKLTPMTPALAALRGPSKPDAETE